MCVHKSCPCAFRSHGWGLFVVLQPEWLVDAGMIHFQPSHKARLEVPAMALVGNMLSYATELDRIV
jgi:hypothetical protein